MPIRAMSPALMVAAALLPVAAAAEPTADPKTLYDQHCVQCHGTEVYTRPDRKVGSLAALGTQVRMCEQNLGLKWFDEDVDAVTALLNRDFYKFGQ